MKERAIPAYPMVASLGFGTETFFQSLNGEVRDRGEYWVVRTPGIPSFIWGNYLLFKREPQGGDLPRWQRAYSEEFSDMRDGLIATAFGWTTPRAGASGAFLSAGFKLEQSMAMKASKVRRPTKFNENLEVRALESDRDWVEIEALVVEGKLDGPSTPERLNFIAARMREYRALSDAGMGTWFGGYLQGKAVGNLGIYRSAQLGRFQELVVHPEHRRQGVCGALAFAAATHALRNMGLSELVIVADEGSPAHQIYATLGFADQEREYGLARMRGD